MVIEVNGIELHWEEAGEGEPLLWLHGAMGCGADWQYIFNECPPGYRLIAPDLRGHGSSTNPSGSFTFRQCADDMRALLAHLHLPSVKAIGVSGGGLVLLHMATAVPGSIGSMVVVSAPPYFPERCRTIQRQVSESTIGAAEMERMRQRHRHGEAQIRRLFEMVHGFADSVDDVNFTPPYLATITAETLIVFGDRDPLYDVTLGLELYRSIPRSYLWVVPNGGHGPVFGDAAAEFAAIALPFLRGAWSRT
jgi:pimeloyl-ACP methyl ester carboxylesterase